MRWKHVRIAAIAYELAPEVIASAELEDRLAPVYEHLHIPPGQLEVLTGIEERRYWEPGASLSEHAAAAGRKALAAAGLDGAELGALVYTGVCREAFEPATACRVADTLGVEGDAFVYDISNACLGVLNGMVDLANRIELGQIEAGLVVSCESARSIVDEMSRRMLASPDMELFKTALATLTGGSGAVAVLLCNEARAPQAPRLLGGAARAAPRHHGLCRWGIEGEPGQQASVMSTDSVAVLQHGVELGKETWGAFLEELDWSPEEVDRVVCHQVGEGHRRAILEALELGEDRDYTTHATLGNMGTVSLPLTTAIAAQRGVLCAGHKVGLLGIGSGLNCLMLGCEW